MECFQIYTTSDPESLEGKAILRYYLLNGRQTGDWRSPNRGHKMIMLMVEYKPPRTEQAELPRVNPRDRWDKL